NIMFPTAANTLFGKDIFLKTKNNMKEFQEHFQNYDDDFEYATQLPEYFMRKWSKSKKWLLDVFEKVARHAEGTNPPAGDSKTVLQHLLETITGKRFGPNYGLLLFWAAQANAVPVSFWTLAFILSHPSVYKNIMQEVESVLGKAGKEKVELSNEDLKKLQLIKWCILESIRLRAPGVITKKVTNPVKLQTNPAPHLDLSSRMHCSPSTCLFRKEELVKYMKCPLSLEDGGNVKLIYAKPILETKVFFPQDRWKEANLEQNAFLEGFVAFGGGSHQCPGSPKPFPISYLSPLHLTGTQQPEGSCRIRYKRRA
ncbi:PREDICTED: 24-hydroxycholesterol 7-alpha-hydroxylase, partial [Gekko japonicus]|uniref:Lanosterol 14-alpha demethylase n=1 Tax=Gekko japonicus TaxID=146911 RepID=A0ABM1LD41_GEKJA